MTKTIALILSLLLLSSAAYAERVKGERNPRKQSYYLQTEADGSKTAWCVYGDTGQRRRVALDDNGLAWWTKAGGKAEVRAHRATPKPRITATQLRAQAHEVARPEREALEVCRAEVFAAEVAGSLVAPDCTAVVEMWQMRVEQAEEALRGRVEVVP